MNSQQEPFCGDKNKSTFCVGNSWGRPHASPHNIFLRGDAWGDVWGGYAWVSETGVSKSNTAIIAEISTAIPHTFPHVCNGKYFEHTPSLQTWESPILAKFEGQ